MSPQHLHDQLSPITQALAGRPLDQGLQDWLNLHHGAQSASFAALQHACVTGAAEGWLCAREAPTSQGTLKYGRIFKPDAGLNGFSVDVVDMSNVAGPHHSHPLGEIDLIMPLDNSATFDGHGAGWLVYGPASAHPPTVAQGRALVLYLLPEGRIEFSR